jgi:hypothetical protein
MDVQSISVYRAKYLPESGLNWGWECLTETRNWGGKFSSVQTPQPQAFRGFQASITPRNEKLPTHENMAPHLSGVTCSSGGVPDLPRGKTRKEIVDADPDRYRETKRAWENKKRNAKKDGMPVGDCFRDFLAFLRHVGFRPHPTYQLDRIDPDQGYTLANVRWIPADQNIRRRRSRAGLIAKYMSITGASKATAYRFLKANPARFYALAVVDAFDEEKGMEWAKADSAFSLWCALCTQFHPDELQPSRLTGRQKALLVNLHQRYGVTETRQAIEFTIPNWRKAKWEIHNLPEFPSIGDFLAHAERLIPWATRKEKEEQVERQRAEERRKQREARAEAARKCEEDHQAAIAAKLREPVDLQDRFFSDRLSNHEKWLLDHAVRGATPAPGRGIRRSTLEIQAEAEAAFLHEVAAMVDEGVPGLSDIARRFYEENKERVSPDRVRREQAKWAQFSL